MNAEPSPSEKYPRLSRLLGEVIPGMRLAFGVTWFEGVPTGVIPGWGINRTSFQTFVQKIGPTLEEEHPELPYPKFKSEFRRRVGLFVKHFGADTVKLARAALAYQHLRGLGHSDRFTSVTEVMKAKEDWENQPDVTLFGYALEHDPGEMFEPHPEAPLSWYIRDANGRHLASFGFTLVSQGGKITARIVNIQGSRHRNLLFTSGLTPSSFNAALRRYAKKAEISLSLSEKDMRTLQEEHSMVKKSDRYVVLNYNSEELHVYEKSDDMANLSRSLGENWRVHFVKRFLDLAERKGWQVEGHMPTRFGAFGAKPKEYARLDRQYCQTYHDAGLHPHLDGVWRLKRAE